MHKTRRAPPYPGNAQMPDQRTKVELSLDAKCVLGSVFSFPGCELSFQLIESRPTARMQAALDELVAANIVARNYGYERADGSRAVKYKACIPTEPYRRFGSKCDIIVAEPISG